MKFPFIMALTLASQVHAKDLQKFSCESKTIQELQLPQSARLDINSSREFFTVMNEGSFKIHDSKTLKEIESYKLEDFFVDAAHFSPDRRFILIEPLKDQDKAKIIDRMSGSVKAVPSNLFWLDDNRLGLITDQGENPVFSIIDPATLVQTNISTPGLPKGYWYNFHSDDSELYSTATFGLQSIIRIYSLKEKKIIKYYKFFGVIQSFDLKKNYAVIKNDRKFDLFRLNDQKRIATLSTDNEFTIDHVGDTLFLSEHFTTSATLPDFHQHQRIVVSLKDWSVKKADYEGSWQSITAIDEHYYSVHFTENHKNIFVIKSTDDEKVLETDSKLLQIDHSDVFAFMTDEDEITAFFNVHHPDQLNSQIIGTDIIKNDNYKIAEDLLLSTEENSAGPKLVLWQINQNCTQTSGDK